MKTTTSLLLLTAGTAATQAPEVEYQTRRLFRSEGGGKLSYPPVGEQVSCGPRRTISVVEVAKKLAKDLKVFGWRRIAIQRLTSPPENGGENAQPRSEILLGGDLVLEHPHNLAAEVQPENNESAELPCFPVNEKPAPARATYRFWVRNEQNEYNDEATCIARLFALEALTRPDMQQTPWQIKERFLKPYLHSMKANPDLAGIFNSEDDGTLDCHQYLPGYHPINLVDIRRGAFREEMSDFDALVELFLSYGGKRERTVAIGAAAASSSSSAPAGSAAAFLARIPAFQKKENRVPHANEQGQGPQQTQVGGGGSHNPFQPLDVTPVESLLKHIKYHLNVQSEGLRHRFDQLTRMWRHPEEMNWSEQEARDMVHMLASDKLNELDAERAEAYEHFQATWESEEQVKQASYETARDAYLAEATTGYAYASDSDSEKDEMEAPGAPVQTRRRSGASSYHADLMAAVAEDEAAAAVAQALAQAPPMAMIVAPQQEAVVAPASGLGGDHITDTVRTLSFHLDEAEGDANAMAEGLPQTPPQTPRRAGTPRVPHHPNAARRTDEDVAMSTKYASVSDDPLARAFNGIDSEDEGDEAENQLQPEPAGAARSVARRLGLMDDDSEDANGGAAESGDEQEEDTEMRHLSKAFSQLSSGDVTPMTRGPPNGRADAEQNPQEHARRLTRRLTRVSDAQNGLEARMKGIVSGEDVQVGGASASSSGTAVAVQLEDRALNSNARDMMSPVPPMSPPAPMTPIMAKRAGAITPSRGPRTSDPVDAMTPVSRAHRAFGVQLERTGLLPDPPEIRGNAGTIEDTPQRTPAGRRSEIVDTPSRTPKRNRHSAGFISRENSDDEVRGRNTRSGGPRAHRHSAPAKLPRMPFSSAEESDSDVDIVTRQGRDKWITKRSAARTRAMQHHRSAQFAAKQATKLARREVRREAKKQRQERELEEARKRADEEGLKFLREPTQIQKQQQENLEAVLAQIEEDEKTWQYAMLVAVGEKSRADDEEMKAHFMRYYMALRRDSIVWPTLQMALHVKRVDKVLQKVLAAYANVGIGAEVMPLVQKRAAVIRDVTKGIAAFKQLNWADIQILYGGQVPELVRTLLA